jgi:exodeoxyribonuclease VII large subunit
MNLQLTPNTLNMNNIELMNPEISPIKNSTEVAVYSPASIINILANIIAIPGTNKIIGLRGIYHATGKTPYSGFYYDQLKDEASDYTIQLIVPALIRNQLTDNKTIEVICYITKKAEKEGSVRLLATVTDLVNQTQNKYTSEEIRTLEIQQKKSEIGFRDLDSFIKNCIYEDRKPNINIIIGKSAVIQHDIIDQMSEAVSLYNIKFIQTTISSVVEMIGAIQASNNSDVDILVIARGGGDIDTEAINKSELAEACLNLSPFLVTALGHKVNTPLLERIADKKFITPTAFGQYLKEIYNTTIEDLAQSKAKLVADVTTQLKTVYDKELRNLNEKLLQEQQINKKNIDNLNAQFLVTQNSYNSILKEKESGIKLLESANQIAARYKESYLSLQTATNLKLIIIVVISALAGLAIGFLFR